MKDKRILYSIIGIFMLLTITVGVTYSFFNYTRTGEINNIGTGRINFNSNQSDTLNITNIFPIEASEANISNLDEVTITIQGDTTYSGGEEYLISLVNVENTVNGKKIPLSYVASVSNLGTSSDTYFESRGANTSIYKLEETGRVYDGKEVLIGYITKGSSGVNGNIKIKAFVDADRIAISDTYPESKITYSLNQNMTTEELNACATYVTTTWRYKNDMDSGTTGVTFCQGTGTNYGTTFSEYLAGQSGGFLEEDVNYFIEHNILVQDILQYYDGTTNEWVDGRVVLTTNEWNNLQENNSLSFKIKVESNEGVWVDNPIKTIESCSGCKFMYVTNEKDMWTTWNTENKTPTVLTSELSDSYIDVIKSSGKDYFLGVKLNSNNQVTNVYACGVKGNIPFCIEGTSDGSKYSSNKALLQSENLWNNTCRIYTAVSETISCGDWENVNTLAAGGNARGNTSVGMSDGHECYTSMNGYFSCDYN